MSSLVALEDVWQAAAVDLALEVATPYEVVLPSGARVAARVLVKKFGGDHGMLLVRNYSDVSSVISELIEEGYGFSVMDDPLPGDEYGRQTTIEVLRDWGWTGSQDDTPAWLIGQS